VVSRRINNTVEIVRNIGRKLGGNARKHVYEDRNFKSKMFSGAVIIISSYVFFS
jgi:hypothetical protein